MMEHRRYQGVILDLTYDDANAALDWLTRVFGFEERARYVDKDGAVRQAEIHIGDTECWLDARQIIVTDLEGYRWCFMARLGTGYVQRIPTEEGGLREVLAGDT